jgi:flagellar basal-body rod protein FlgB
MIEAVGVTTSELVKLALDAAVLRHQVLANNIANANTPGFRPSDVDFDEQLRRAALAMAPTGSITAGDYHTSLGGIRETGEHHVELDLEIAKIAENTLRYQSLLTGLGKQTSILRMAISEQAGK